jgi:ATP-binding cassette subfamily B protein
MVSVWGQEGTWESLVPLCQLVALMAGVLLLTEVLGSVTGWIRTAQAELVQDYISARIHSIAGALDLSFYDTPDFYDRLHRARVDASTRPLALVENVGQILQNGLTLIAMAGVLLPFGWWIPIVLAVSALPAFAVVLRHTVRQHQWRLRTTHDQRRVHYYDILLTVREAAMEMRLFGLAGHFQTAYQTLRQRLRSERLHLARNQAMAQLSAGALALLTTGLVTIWMLWRAVQGQISAGDLALFYQAFYQGQGLMRTVLTGVGQIYNNIAFLENLFTFFALEPRIGETSKPLANPVGLHESIRFDQVTFRYPGSSRAVLEKFSLTIPAGQIVALVGTNGAGKSTLIKLLCRS